MYWNAYILSSHWTVCYVFPKLRNTAKYSPHHTLAYILHILKQIYFEKEGKKENYIETFFILQTLQNDKSSVFI